MLQEVSLIIRVASSLRAVVKPRSGAGGLTLQAARRGRTLRRTEPPAQPHLQGIEATWPCAHHAPPLPPAAGTMMRVAIVRVETFRHSCRRDKMGLAGHGVARKTKPRPARWFLLSIARQALVKSRSIFGIADLEQQSGGPAHLAIARRRRAPVA